MADPVHPKPVRGRTPATAGRAPSPARQYGIFFILIVLPPLALNAFAILQPWAEPKFLYRDPLLLAQNQFEWLRLNPENLEIHCCSWWWGALSNLGVLVWSATAGALGLAFVALTLREGRAGRTGGFFALAFLLTALFAADDLFQIHEQPRLFGPLKGEAVIYPLMAALLSGYVFFHATVLRRHRLVLGLALACFAVSLLADQILPQVGATVVVEDAAKLFGIFFWMAFHVMASVEALAARPVSFAGPER